MKRKLLTISGRVLLAVTLSVSSLSLPCTSFSARAEVVEQALLHMMESMQPKQSDENDDQ